MKIETGMAETRYAIAKFIQRSGVSAERDGDFHALAKIKPFQRGLACEVWIGRAIVGDHAAQVAAQRRDRNVVGNVKHSKLLGKIVSVRVRKQPLREVVRKTIGHEVMAAQGLKHVMKNGCGAGVIQPG